jgi:hypothetical protein
MNTIFCPVARIQALSGQSTTKKSHKESTMKDRILPEDYESIEAHIRRARLERSVAMAKIFADGADALGRGVSRVVGSVLSSFSGARDARTIEADALLRRPLHR